jgi:hypothetical protein
MGHNIYVTLLDLSGIKLGDVGAAALAMTVSVVKFDLAKRNGEVTVSEMGGQLQTGQNQ